MGVVRSTEYGVWHVLTRTKSGHGPVFDLAMFLLVLFSSLGPTGSRAYLKT